MLSCMGANLTDLTKKYFFFLFNKLELNLATQEILLSTSKMTTAMKTKVIIIWFKLLLIITYFNIAIVVLITRGDTRLQILIQNLTLNSDFI